MLLYNKNYHLPEEHESIYKVSVTWNDQWKREVRQLTYWKQSHKARSSAQHAQALGGCSVWMETPKS